MKFGDLESIGHNIADSLASGVGLMIGVYEMDVFGEAARSPEGFMLVDFLAGATEGAKPSPLLANAIRLYAGELPALCERHGASVSAFRRLAARFHQDRGGPCFIVMVEDQTGKASERRYVGLPGRRPLTRDDLGRVRRSRARLP